MQIPRIAYMISCPFKGDKTVPLFDYEFPHRIWWDLRRDNWPDCMVAEFTLLVDPKLFGKKVA